MCDTVSTIWYGRVVPTATQRTKVRQSRAESRARIVAAAARLLRERSYADLTVDEVMREAGQGRTLFYRHFDDLADLLARASTEAIESLFAAQRVLGADPVDARAAVPPAMELAAEAYERHGPLLRGVAEAAAGDERLAAAEDAMRRRFDDLAERLLRETRAPVTDPAQTARALNLMNEAYLLETFGRTPRATRAVAVATLTEIWLAVIQP